DIKFSGVKDQKFPFTLFVALYIRRKIVPLSAVITVGYGDELVGGEVGISSTEYGGVFFSHPDDRSGARDDQPLEPFVQAMRNGARRSRPATGYPRIPKMRSPWQSGQIRQREAHQVISPARAGGEELLRLRFSRHFKPGYDRRQNPHVVLIGNAQRRQDPTP